MDPDERSFRLEKSKINEVDYSKNTLVFNVVSTFRLAKLLAPKDPFDITVKFFIRNLKGKKENKFVSRKAHKDVGYFLTQDSNTKHITRMNIGEKGDHKSIHYYIKGVPEKRKKAFEKSFKNWNLSLSDFSDKKILTYEFLDAGDENYHFVQTGDVRYNVIEYDDKDEAPYLGLGPSIANQWSGEILSGSVLVQGQRLVDSLTDWYEASLESNEPVLQIQEDDGAKFKAFFRGEKLKIPAQMPEYQDNVSNTFATFPENVTLDEFIDKVFETTVTHELGHNLGFRHNFKGSLKTSEETKTVSNSIMEYLPLEYDINNRLGDYDLEAFAYGYTGKEPSGTEPYCTDEDIPEVFSFFPRTDTSPECARFDYTKDPLKYHLDRIKKGFDFVVGTGDPTSEGWSDSQMSKILILNIAHAGFFYSRADETSDTWVAWSPNGRPDESTAAIKEHVVSELKRVLCSDNYQSQIDLKFDEEMAEEVSDKLESFRERLTKKFHINHQIPTKSLACGE